MNVLVVLLTPLLLAGAADKKSLKAEVQALQKELHRELLLTREDIQVDGPAPARGTGSQLADGSVHVHADSSVAFEALSLVLFERLRLRGTSRLVARVRSPSVHQPRWHWRAPGGSSAPQAWDYVPQTGLEVDHSVSMIIDIAEGESPREALERAFYLPGQEPDQAALDRCLKRYPEEKQEISRMRCGLETSARKKSDAR